MNIADFFNRWNTKKQETHKKEISPQFYDGEIWWVAFGQNIATEIYGKGDDFLRPAIVVRKVFGDAGIVIPITSQKKKGSYYFEFENKKGEKQYAILHQIKSIDAKRLHHRFGEMKQADFQKLQKAFIRFFIKNNPVETTGNP